MRILADENIPHVQELFAQFGEVTTLPGRAIDAAAVAKADALLVRSVTRVDAALVRDAPTRFVGSATIGTDHVDEAALREQGIIFAHAPGSNAESVAEYVTAALYEWAHERQHPLRGRTLGVVGYGNIGSRIARRAEALGMRVLVNDPPLQERGVVPAVGGGFHSFRDLVAASDAVTVHVPFTSAGPHATRGMIARDALDRMKPDALLINTARGAVVSGEDLLNALRARPSFQAVLDVFEGEPEPDESLIERLFLATPHIAGYSYDGKLNGTLMLFDAFSRFLGVESWPTLNDADGMRRLNVPSAGDETTWLRGLVRQMYDIRSDDVRMRLLLDLPPDRRAAHFNLLRKEYPRRRSFGHHCVPEAEVPASLREAVRDGLHVALSCPVMR